MGMFITEVLAQHAMDRPDASAIEYEGNRWTYRELLNNAQKIAGYMQQQGYKKETSLRNLCLIRTCLWLFIMGYSLQD